MPPDPAPITHDEARRLYLETGTPVRAIAEQLRLSEPSFRKLRVRLGWPARPGPGPKEPRRLGRPPTLVGLVFRLRRQIGRRLAELEAAEGAASAAEYAALVRAMNELARLETRAGPAPAEAGEGGDDGPTSDPGALREAIARRVELFGAGGPAPGLPGDAAPP